MATAIEDNFVDWAKLALADKKSVPRGGKLGIVVYACKRLLQIMGSLAMFELNGILSCFTTVLLLLQVLVNCKHHEEEERSRRRRMLFTCSDTKLCIKGCP